MQICKVSLFPYKPHGEVLLPEFVSTKERKLRILGEIPFKIYLVSFKIELPESFFFKWTAIHLNKYQVNEMNEPILSKRK